MNLIIVESPNKIHTISKIMGPNYVVLATIGHMREINSTGAYKTGIDCKNKFDVDFVFTKSKKENIKKIKEAAKTADKIYICSDDDREGHEIAEEVVELLKQYKKKLIRTTFNEITESAVKNAINNPTGFNENMALAAEARLIIDRLIGYRTSPVVLSKIGAPSAGRVQSALLNLLAEKEEAIRKFKPVKYFDIFLDFKKGNSNLTAKLFQIKTKKIEKITDKMVVDEVIKNCKPGEYTIDKITQKEKLIEPKLPLTTAALQQLASNILNWSPAKTQKFAQSCFEKGYITYIRTDAVRFAPEFIESAKDHIEKNFGKNLYRGLNIPKEKNEHAQNAHEAIRPTDLQNTPSKMTQILDNDEAKLYKLIYNYSLAAFFVPAKVLDTDIIIKNSDYLFKTSGRIVTFESFLQLTNDLEQSKKLPEFKENEKINDKELYFVEKETLPPQRYSEAGLVKLMQDTGIGRPSTFSATIETLKKREYIKVEKKSVYVSEMGLKLNTFLKKYFEGFFEPKYTAEMEINLDKISNGEEAKLDFLEDFWKYFEPIVLKAAREANKDKPKPEIAEGKFCPDCGSQLVIREGKYGKFYACSKFPKCKYTEQIEDTSAEKLQCEACGDGIMVKRKSKKGNYFYACNRYPKCTHCLSEEEYNLKISNLNKPSDASNDRTI